MAIGYLYGYGEDSNKSQQQRDEELLAAFLGDEEEEEEKAFSSESEYGERRERERESTWYCHLDDDHIST